MRFLILKSRFAERLGLTPLFNGLCGVPWILISLSLQMGGRTNVHNELLCRFTFPEKPGALMKFLDAFSPRWNISLFHYRAQVI